MTPWPGARALHGGADRVALDGPGAVWLCGKHYLAPDPEAALRRTGTDTVVCLCEQGELASRYPDYGEWLRFNQPGRALWWPVPDLGVPADPDGLLGDLNARLGRGERLLIHCGAGLGRAGTVAIALLLGAGVPLTTATERVASARRGAGPQAAEQAAFLAGLAGGPTEGRAPGLP